MDKCIVCDAKSKHPVQCAFSHFRFIDTSENYFKYLKGNSQITGSYWGGLLSVLGLTFPFFNTIRHWKYRKVRLAIEGITDRDGYLLTNQTCFIDKEPQGATMSLSDRDLELAKKHALPFTIDSRVLTVIGFSPTNLAAFLAERDAQQADKVREMERDAARYRYLKKTMRGAYGNSDYGPKPRITWHFPSHHFTGRKDMTWEQALDASIDEAMKGGEK